MIEGLEACHNDFMTQHTDGVVKVHSFKWLGFVQYIHTTTGLPHHSKAPRVMLVHRQFVLGTATDMLHLPKNYKLGNIIFGDYEQEELECGLSLEQIKMGMQCSRAYLEMPYKTILPHPEFSRFGVGNSIALTKLLRPLKSNYMVPVCLPTLSERIKRSKNRQVFMVDYLSSVPRDFDSEKMAKRTLKLFTHRECRVHRMKSRLGSEGVTHVLCSSGCGVRPGAPIISRTSEGNFQLIGITAGGGACTRRTMRRRLNKEPPLYIDVYPYVSWIVNVITAHEFPLPYPENFRLYAPGYAMSPRHDVRYVRGGYEAWVARSYASGQCFKKRHQARPNFYSERFEVNADPPGKMNVNIEINAGLTCRILCVRIMLPNRYHRPLIKGVGGYNISIQFTTDWFPYTFYFGLTLTGRIATASEYDVFLSERRDWTDIGYMGGKIEEGSIILPSHDDGPD